jgi:hypothetical protein
VIEVRHVFDVLDDAGWWVDVTMVVILAVIAVADRVLLRRWAR